MWRKGRSLDGFLHAASLDDDNHIALFADGKEVKLLTTDIATAVVHLFTLLKGCVPNIQ